MNRSDLHHFPGSVSRDRMAIAAAALLAVGLGSIGRMAWRESDEAWDHTPECEGFRPMLGMR
jgi:hypothetical protein